MSTAPPINLAINLAINLPTNLPAIPCAHEPLPKELA